MSQSATHETDALLAEYMRVINQKDADILDLMGKVERLDVAGHKREERYRAKLADMKTAVLSFQSKAEGADSRHEGDALRYDRLRTERDNLAADVVTLKGALQRHEDHLKGVVRSSSKAHRSDLSVREKLEQEVQELRRAYEGKAQSTLDRLGALEAQLSGSKRRLHDAAEDAHKWQAECQALQQQLADRAAAHKELKRRQRDLLSRDEAAAEVQHSDARHSAQLAGLEKEVKRLRSEVAAEAASNGRKDAALAVLKTDYARADQELSAVKRGAHDTELAVAQERLHAVQHLDEQRADMGHHLADARDQLARLALAKSHSDGDASALSVRVQELEAAQAVVARRWQDYEADRDGEQHQLKMLLAEAQRDADAARRWSEQSGAEARAAHDKHAAEREAHTRDATELRADLDKARISAMGTGESLARGEAAAAEMRRELAVLRNELSHDRVRATGMEQDLRAQVAALEDTATAMDAERRATTGRYEDQVRALHAERAATEQHWKAERHREADDAARVVAALRLQLVSEEDRCGSLETESARHLASSVAKDERERTLVASQRELDSKVVQLELAASEREAALMSLRRAVETGGVQLANAHQQLDAARLHADEATSAGEVLRVELATARVTLKSRDTELEEGGRRQARVEAAAAQHGEDAERQIATLKQRVERLVGEVHGAEQGTMAVRADVSRLEARHAEECGKLNREVLAPLEEKCASLVALNQRAQYDLAERNARVEVLNADVAARSADVAGLSADVAALSADVAEGERTAQQLRAASVENDRLHNTIEQLRATGERGAVHEREAARRLQHDLESASARAANTEGSLHSASMEIASLRQRDVTLTTQLSAKAAELDALAQRHANLESVHAIAEQRAADLQHHDADLRSQLDDEREAHTALQVCFEKQQEQLEAGRRMREEDLQSRERTRENQRQLYASPMPSWGAEAK
jgi:chromosome segregation ATPase